MYMYVQVRCVAKYSSDLNQKKFLCFVSFFCDPEKVHCVNVYFIKEKKIFDKYNAPTMSFTLEILMKEGIHERPRQCSTCQILFS